MKGKSKTPKVVKATEENTSGEISAGVQEQPATLPPAKGIEVETQPEVQPPTEQEVKLEALNAEVEAIAAGKPWRSVVYSFETKAKGTTGTNLQYYFDCKKNEILTGQECNFVRPFSPPMAQVPQKKHGLQPMGVQPTAMKVKHCPTC